MAIKEIIHLPDPRLKLKSTPFDGVDAQVRRLADDMLETMYDAPGVGLAAIQIALPKRLFVIDVARKDDPHNPIVFINPEITAFSGEPAPYEEGCLSIPEYFAEVMRPPIVTIQYLDLNGKLQTLEADGLLARCIQHEFDHLNGVMFIDHLSRLRRERVITKYTKIAKEKLLDDMS